MPIEDIHTMTLEQVDDQGSTVLYKGAPGTGKTHNILTWPQPIVGAYFDSNLMTLRNAMKAGVEVTPYFCKDWRQFADVFVPAVTNREIKARTIFIDTLDPLGLKMQKDIQGTRPRLTQADFGTILNRWVDVMGQLVDSTKHSASGPGYNLVCSVHLKDVTDDNGSLLRVSPQLMGAFKDMLEQFFDWVLLCEASVVAKTVAGKSVFTKHYQVRTVPPTPQHTCKGGGLPPVCGGTYTELMAAVEAELNTQLEPTGKTEVLATVSTE